MVSRFRAECFLSASFVIHEQSAAIQSDPAQPWIAALRSRVTIHIYVSGSKPRKSAETPNKPQEGMLGCFGEALATYGTKPSIKCF
jgi:hypothetical protein